MTNPFQTTDPWEVSLDRMLPAGNHVVDIAEAEDDTSSNNNPQLKLKLANGDGAIRDWLTITEGTVSKVVALAQAAGIRLPEDDDLAEPGVSLRLKQSWIDLLFNKRVGIVVRDEESNKVDPNTGGFIMRPRVQGYVDWTRIAKSDIPNGSSFQAGQSKPKTDIPF